MKFYGIKVEGDIVIPVYISTAAAGAPEEAGELILSTDKGKLYVATSAGVWKSTGETTFIELTDAPSAYSGYANYLTAVNTGANGLEFIPPSSVGRTTFDSLEDTPEFYGDLSKAGRLVSIDSAATALEYQSVSASLVVQSTSAGQNLRIAVFDGNTRNIKTGHTNAYVDVSGNVYGTKVYNAVFNDIADYIEVENQAIEVLPGRVYVIDIDGNAEVSKFYCQEGIIGIVTDTYGMGVGKDKNSFKKRIPICIGGFVLAHVDKIYLPGTPLTSGPNGILTEIRMEDKRDFPERIVGTFFKKETLPVWYGIDVNNRHWVKVI